MPEYEAWRTSLGASASKWTIKYYKVCLSLLVPVVFVSLFFCFCDFPLLALVNSVGIR